MIGGFFILEAKDRAAAIEMTRRFVEVHLKVLGDAFKQPPSVVLAHAISLEGETRCYLLAGMPL